MATIIFFEKPGCINNTKQKKLLTLAGHKVVARNLLTHPWTRIELLDFFNNMPVADWFNPNAPSITGGIVFPEAYDREGAIAAMLADPLLIKRPLMRIDGSPVAGFDVAALSEMIPLHASSHPEILPLSTENLVDCPRKNSSANCD